MKKRIILLFVAFLIAFGFNACTNNPTENPVEKRIKQSFKVHDDNVNNVDLRKQNISIRRQSTRQNFLCTKRQKRWRFLF